MRQGQPRDDRSNAAKSTRAVSWACISWALALTAALRASRATAAGAAGAGMVDLVRDGLRAGSRISTTFVAVFAGTFIGDAPGMVGTPKGWGGTQGSPPTQLDTPIPLTLGLGARDPQEYWTGGRRVGHPSKRRTYPVSGSCQRGLFGRTSNSPRGAFCASHQRRECQAESAGEAAEDGCRGTRLVPLDLADHGARDTGSL
jgi:hypothetical protein